MLTTTLHLAAGEPSAAWPRHTIDNTSRGADGVRLADVNGDGLLDVATGWEEGGQVRVYLHPGAKKTNQPWPSVTVGNVRSPEDAVFADLDGDGAIDVVSSCEGGQRSMFVHWAPKDPSKYLDSEAWKTEEVPAAANAKLWMFCLPLQVDGRYGVDLVAGSKGDDAEVGWFEAPADPRNLAKWQWHGIYKAGWIMSLLSIDVDADGDHDVVLSDRKGGGRGCYWLENPGPGTKQTQAWTKHEIGGLGKQVMFMTPGELNGDERGDFVVAVSGGDLLYLQRTQDEKPAWEEFSIRMPPNTGTGKGVNIGDVDLDGRADVVFSCENAKEKSGVMWLSYDPAKGPTHPQWTAHEISGTERGVKYDLVELIDLDGDGDLDVITCEERDNLGVIWYENRVR